MILWESDACIMVEKFLNMVISQYELLQCIMNNCDPCFHGHFWDELMC